MRASVVVATSKSSMTTVETPASPVSTTGLPVRTWKSCAKISTVAGERWKPIAPMGESKPAANNGKADLFILCGECEEQFAQQE